MKRKEEAIPKQRKPKKTCNADENRENKNKFKDRLCDQVVQTTISANLYQF